MAWHAARLQPLQLERWASYDSLMCVLVLARRYINPDKYPEVVRSLVGPISDDEVRREQKLCQTLGAYRLPPACQ